MSMGYIFFFFLTSHAHAHAVKAERLHQVLSAIAKQIGLLGNYNRNWGVLVMGSMLCMSLLLRTDEESVALFDSHTIAGEQGCGTLVFSTLMDVCKHIVTNHLPYSSIPELDERQLLVIVPASTEWIYMGFSFFYITTAAFFWYNFVSAFLCLLRGASSLLFNSSIHWDICFERVAGRLTRVVYVRACFFVWRDCSKHLPFIGTHPSSTIKSSWWFLSKVGRFSPLMTLFWCTF